MKKIILITLIVMVLLVKGVFGITCDATPASTTIDLGSSKKVTISCSDWGSVTSVTVEPTQYNANCLSLDKDSDTITQGVTKDFTITATSMACNPSVDDRTIVWKFTPNTGSTPSKSTVVNIQSGLTLSASFKQAPYSATQGGEVTIILEVSTSANEDINNINIDMSQSDVDLSDKSINKIAASQGEKTQQVSWTITAPSPGTYTIKAVVTSQNADSDTATTTLSVSSAQTGGEEEEEGGGGGGGAAGAAEKVTNASKKLELVPGVGLRNNTKLQTALEKVLAKGRLSSEAIENLIRLSQSISSEIELRKEFKIQDGNSYLSTKLKYKGNKKAINFIVYDKVPKSFANSSDLITVIAPGANYSVVESDPEYLFLYPKLNPNQEITISYMVSGEKDASVINETFTEIYTESLEEVKGPTENVTQICSPGEKRCLGNDLQECNPEGTAWVTKETCEFGCLNNRCREKPEEISTNLLIAVILLLIAVVIAVGYFFLYKKKKLIF